MPETDAWCIKNVPSLALSFWAISYGSVSRNILRQLFSTFCLSLFYHGNRHPLLWSPNSVNGSERCVA